MRPEDFIRARVAAPFVPFRDLETLPVFPRFFFLAAALRFGLAPFLGSGFGHARFVVAFFLAVVFLARFALAVLTTVFLPGARAFLAAGFFLAFARCAVFFSLASSFVSCAW